MNRWNPLLCTELVMLTALALATSTGCAGTAMPNFSSPGSAGQQRRTALQFDPYPLDDVAPPVAGGRPREYARPIPEVQRGQAFAPRPTVMQPMQWPAWTQSIAPAPATTYPAAPYPSTPPVQMTPVQSAPSYQVRPPY